MAWDLLTTFPEQWRLDIGKNGEFPFCCYLTCILPRKIEKKNVTNTDVDPERPYHLSNYSLYNSDLSW